MRHNKEGVAWTERSVRVAAAKQLESSAAIWGKPPPTNDVTPQPEGGKGRLKKNTAGLKTLGERELGKHCAEKERRRGPPNKKRQDRTLQQPNQQPAKVETVEVGKWIKTMGGHSVDPQWKEKPPEGGHGP